VNLNLKYCESNDVSFIREKYKNIIEMLVTKSDDCLFKNFSIYDFIIKNKITGKNCLDVGAGTSALGFLLCDYFEKVYIVDMAEPNKFTHDKLIHIRDDFFNYSKSLEDNFFDTIVESCAITHFEYNKDENLGIKKCAIEINRLLKPNGYFIMSSDVILEDSQENFGQKEFIKASEIIEIFKMNNLNLIQSFDYSAKDTGLTIKINYNNNPNFTLNYANFVFQKG